MEFEVLPPESAHERMCHQYRHLLNERTKAMLESQPNPTSIDDEQWYETAANACIAAGLGWNGPAAQHWVIKKLNHETNP